MDAKMIKSASQAKGLRLTGLISIGKKCITSLMIREKHIKAAKRFQLID